MDRVFSLMIGVIIVIMLGLFVCETYLSITANNVLTSSKPIKPIVKINCVEVDGSKECDTTYTYKK